MVRFSAAGVLVACVLGAGGLAASQPQVFRGTTDLVRVFVTVTDRDGRLVTSLTRDAFEVRDEGKPQPITLFDNSPQPIRLVLMLDVSGSMSGNLPLLRGAAEQLVARLRPDDRARIGSFGHEISIAPAFTRDARELLGSLPESIHPDAPTPLWRALDQALDAFEDTGDERPVILVLSDGKDSGPIGFGREVSSQADIIDRARADDVMVYAVGMRSRRARQAPPGIGRGSLHAMLTADLPDPGLARVAQETGGGYAEIGFGEDLGAAFARVADELHSQYLLGFVPPKRDGKVHDIDVRLSERGLTPRARKSYVAPRERPGSNGAY
ncbi:MAG TPA: VWA domain-containing protein [Vicinamibacterales bacterium]|nr:VWA domain-containing protein [Vicinamibacterales bacterium]